MSDPRDDLRRELRALMVTVFGPVVEWMSRRTRLQFAAMYVAVLASWALLIVWAVTRP